MGTKYGSIECRYCDRQTQATKRTPNHVLHLLLSLLSCGAWVFVWLLVALNLGLTGWRCSTCGQYARDYSTVVGAILGLVLLAAGVLLALALFAGG